MIARQKCIRFLVIFQQIVVVGFLLFISLPGVSAQQDLDVTSHETSYTQGKKGKAYIYWGWNRGWYTKSDLTLKGDDYNITLEQVIAKDRQSTFSLETYFHPAKISIPQYNLRVGYYLSDKWEISAGVDHMKYVLQQDQVAQISGQIDIEDSPYAGVYSNEAIIISDDFLTYEHTDGLNYINAELRHTYTLYQRSKISIHSQQGFGLGAVVPKTNATLFGGQRYDDFHFSGYGLGLIGGLQALFFDRAFIQVEAKCGFMHLPRVRTTDSSSDRGSQHFFWSQANVVFGYEFGGRRNTD